MHTLNRLIFTFITNFLCGNENFGDGIFIPGNVSPCTYGILGTNIGVFGKFSNGISGISILVQKLAAIEMAHFGQ